MAFVLDASVAMAWCFEDKSTPRTEAALNSLGGQSALVPTLWPTEVANVLLVAERRKRITEFQAERFTTLLRELPIHIDTNLPDMKLLLSVGRRHGLSSYDASYFVLAESAGLPLATEDRKLRAAANSAGIPLFTNA